MSIGRVASVWSPELVPAKLSIAFACAIVRSCGSHVPAVFLPLKVWVAISDSLALVTTLLSIVRVAPEAVTVMSHLSQSVMPAPPPITCSATLVTNLGRFFMCEASSLSSSLSVGRLDSFSSISLAVSDDPSLPSFPFSQSLPSCQSSPSTQSLPSFPSIPLTIFGFIVSTLLISDDSVSIVVSISSISQSISMTLLSTTDTLSPII